MPVRVILRGKETEVESNLTLEQALQKMGLCVENYLALRDGLLLEKEELLHDGNEIKLVAVISGGAPTGEYQVNA
jgi:sulfur carrier protein ThiS